MSDERLPYAAPQLSELGSLRELTLSDSIPTGPGDADYYDDYSGTPGLS